MRIQLSGTDDSMNKFTVHDGLVAPLDRANVDTDQIIPKQFLKSIHRSGFGANLFDEWRYLDRGEPGMDNARRPLNPDFVLNQPRYQGASILVARRNFGCGSSREHAPWALQDYGFDVVIAPSFGDIFRQNCLNIGLLPVELPAEQVKELMERAARGEELTVDLETRTAGGFPFAIDEFQRRCLLEGLDEIGLTLQREDAIAAYERAHAPRVATTAL